MEQQPIVVPPFLSEEERAQLVHFCSIMSRKSEVAEDLVQETLLEAWRHEQALLHPSRRLQWMMGIARNVCLRWQRKQAREDAHRYQEEGIQQEQRETREDQLFIDDDTIELSIERKELLDLLERALALLPRDTRTVLLRHYVDDLPLAQVAQQLGTNTNALAVRLQRGKRALRRLLTQDMQQELTVHRQFAASATWEVTPLWCYRCGKQHLLGKRVPNEGKLLLKCPECNPGEYQFLSRHELPLLRNMKSYKPMLTKLRNWSHEYYRAALAAYFSDGIFPCETCRQSMMVLFAPVEQLPNWLQMVLSNWQWTDGVKTLHTFCPRCQITCNTTLSGLLMHVPEVHAFAHAQLRIRTLPTRLLETEGRSALLTRIESITDNLALNIITDEETFRVLCIKQEGF